jgi:hypothetical protein
MKRGAGQGTPNFIANIQPCKTISAEQISRPETAVIGENLSAIALYNDISACQNPDQLDAMARIVWERYGAGAISDDEASYLDSCIRRRRPLSRRTSIGKFAVAGTMNGRISRFLPRQRQRSPDRKASRDRRRMLGGSSALPDNLRHHYTEGQRSVLCIVAGEIKRHGVCDLPIDKIAALAGVWPGLRLSGSMPEDCTAVMCRNISGPPESSLMKPKPRSGFHIFKVPAGIARYFPFASADRRGPREIRSGPW